MMTSQDSPGPSRRGLVASAALAPVAAALTAGPAVAADPTDEAAWARVAALYDPRPPNVIQFENGHFGAMAKATRAAFETYTARVNRETTLYTRGPVSADLQAARARAAGLLGVDVEEIAFTRGGTESMQVLIEGYNRLRAGDGVLYADLDYDSMQAGMESLRRLRGARVVKFNLPEPPTRQAVLDAYAAQLEANPDVRLVLVTHISHRTGLLNPVRELTAMARERGADVLLDCGHALGQTEFSLRELGVDFAGLNLHKWIGAPLGVGLVYIRRERLNAIDPSPLEAAFVDRADAGLGRIDSRIHTGTVSYASILAVPDAIAVHESIGVANKAARLRYLRDRWVSQVRGARGVEVLTPDDHAMHAGITSFRITGKTSMADNAALRAALFERHKVFVIERAGPARGACLRATPSMLTTAADADALAAAVLSLAGA